MSLLALTVPSKAFWYLTRGTGAVSLLLLTAVVVLGIANSVRWAPDATPRFVVQRVHRNISLLALAFIAVHVVTAVLDVFAPIRWLDAVVPFASAYRPVWLGLGAVAFDFLLAVAITSLVRSRLRYGAWRAVHWTAYGCWLVAVFHGLGTGSDARQVWMLALVAVSTAAVLAAVVWRVTIGWTGWAPGRVGLALASALAVPALAVWAFLGPLRPGWAQVAGTPAHLLAPAVTVASAITSEPAVAPLVLPSRATFDGSSRVQGSGAAVTLSVAGRTTGTPALDLAIRLQGSQQGQSFSIGSGSVVLTPPEGAAAYRGSVLGVSGGVLVADLSDGHGDQIEVQLAMSFTSPGSVSGQLAIQAMSTTT